MSSQLIEIIAVHLKFSAIDSISFDSCSYWYTVCNFETVDASKVNQMKCMQDVVTITTEEEEGKTIDKFIHTISDCDHENDLAGIRRQ